MVEIKTYSPEYQSSVINALQELQRFEQNLSDTRKISTEKLAKDYLKKMLNNTQSNNGKIFVSVIDQRFAGFICYYLINEDVVFETTDSNHYALISDICILSKFRKQGISTILFDAVFKDLTAMNFQGRIRLTSLANNENASKAYLKYGFEPYEITYEKFISVNS